MGAGTESSVGLEEILPGLTKSATMQVIWDSAYLEEAGALRTLPRAPFMRQNV